MIKRLLLGLLLLAAFALLWALRELYRPFRAYSGNQFVVIEPKTPSAEVAGILVEKGVLAHRAPFLLRYWLSRPRHPLMAGEYLFDRPMRPADVYRKLVRGEVYLHPVVVPEGSDRFDIARILQERMGINPADFLEETSSASRVRDLDPDAPSLEGYLFPDTYLFARGVSAAAVANTMVARFRREMESKFLSEIQSSNSSLHEVITLASLVEKETPDPAERPVIAGVFERRLNKRMPLQCDPTVVYALRLHQGLADLRSEPITRSDLRLDSPYNTYRRAGLPPGPICNPGRASILAALNPAPGDSLYFVSNSRGSHFFARTLQEHQRNVARYRRQAAAQNASKSRGARGRARAD